MLQLGHWWNDVQHLQGLPEHARLTECDRATLPNKIIGEICHSYIFCPQMVSLL
jgi:hypothetical protein